MSKTVTLKEEDFRVLVALARYSYGQFGDEHFDSFWTKADDGLAPVQVHDDALTEKAVGKLIDECMKKLMNLEKPTSNSEDTEVTRPSHYGGEDNPFEPIKIIEHYGMGFLDGNALKYMLRAGKKSGEPISKDIEKACWYLSRLRDNLRKNASQPPRSSS